MLFLTCHEQKFVKLVLEYEFTISGQSGEIHMVAGNNFESSEWNLLHVIIPAPGNLRWFIVLEGLCTPTLGTVLTFDTS
jgi:hypothetical protein